MKKILLYGNFSENMLNALRTKCPEGFHVEHQPVGCDLSLLADADYIINRGGEVNAAVIQAAQNTKLIQKWGVGYDKIDVKTAGERGIPVAICVGGNAMPVAELAVTLMLDVLRSLPEAGGLVQRPLLPQSLSAPRKDSGTGGHRQHRPEGGRHCPGRV